MLEVLYPTGARLEFVFGDLELFRHLLRLVPDHGVSKLHLLVAALVQPFGKFGFDLGEL
jgi:hypothetical protein